MHSRPKTTFLAARCAIGFLLVPWTAHAETLGNFAQPETVFEEWVPYGRLADGTWAQGNKARPEWWTVEEGALRGQNFPEEKHAAGISWKKPLPQKLAETGARISWRVKVTDTSRGTLRIFGISRGPFSEELTDNHVLALDVSRTGLRLWNGNRELTGPAPNQESRRFRNTVLEQKSDGGVTPGTWHALVLEIKGNDAQVLLDGHPAVTLRLNNPQPLRSLSLEADGNKQTPGLVWFADIAVTPPPSAP